MRDPLEWLRSMQAACDKTSNFRIAANYKAAADELERLQRVEADHKNVLRASLLEPNGIDLTNRLTRFALDNRDTEQPRK